MKYLFLFIALLTSYVVSAQKPELIIPVGHGDQVYLAKYSADGSLLMSAGISISEVKVWDTRTGRLLKNIPLESFPSSLQSTKDGKMLVISTKTEICFFDRKNLALLHKLPHGAEDLAVGTNKVFALVTDAANAFHIESINLTNFEASTLYSNKNESAQIISLSPAEDKLLFESTFSSSVVDVLTGALLKSTHNETGQTVLAFTPSGNLLGLSDKGKSKSAPFTMNTNDLSIIKNMDVKVPTSYRLQSLRNQIVFGKNNEVILSDDEGIVIADYETGKKVKQLKMPGSYIICLSITGNKLITGDKFKGTLIEYDLTTGEIIKTYGSNIIQPIRWETASKATGLIIDGIFNSPCAYFKSNEKGKVESATFQAALKEVISVVGISADASIIATYNQKALQLYKSNELDKPYLSFELPDTKVAALGITPNNQKLIVVYYKYIAVYDIKSGKLIKEISNDPYADKLVKNEYLNSEKYHITISDDSKFIAVNTYGLALFNLETYKLVGSPPVDADGIRFSADGKTLYFVKNLGGTGGYTWGESEIMAMQPPIEKPLNIGSIENSTKGIKLNAAISPELNLIAYPVKNEIWVYNREKFVNTLFLKGHQGKVTQLRWLPNGILVSSSADNTIRFWDTKKGVELAKLILFQETNNWVVVTPQGQFDASESAMKKLYYVQGGETIALESLYEKFYTPNLLARLMQGDALPAPDVDVTQLAPPPKVKMTFDVARNLVVSNAVPILEWKNETITIKVNAECAESTIDEIRLYLNDKLLGNTDRNLEVVDADQKTLSKSFTIKLAPGINSFKAIALNKQRTESQPDETDVNYIPANNTPAPATDDVKLHLVVIGVNDYKNPKYNLNYAKADAISIKEELEQNHGIFNSTKVYFITDAEATKTNIEATLNLVIKEAMPKDLFIFYYAGHGVMSDSQPQKEFYIVPYDVTQLYGADDALAQKGISAKELQEFSKNIAAQKQLFILDACQSAGMLQLMASRGAAEERAIAQLARSTGSHWLTASGSDQFATEFAQLGHGVFTYVLLKGLKGGAANGDKQITVNELKAYIEVQVPELSQKYKGSPQYPSSYGYGNDFPIEVIK